MEFVEGYVEQPIIVRTCAFCCWHRSQLAGRKKIGWYNHFCFHPKWKKREDKERYIGTDVETPSWCPVGKANVSEGKEDC